MSSATDAIRTSTPLITWMHNGVEQTADFNATFAETHRPELFSPARQVQNYAGQSHRPGLYWSSKQNDHIVFESRLEARWLTIYDFDPEVTAVSSQPFKITGFENGSEWDRFPDLFVRYADGTAAVIDVKPLAFTEKPDVKAGFTRARRACESVGYNYEVATEPEPIFWSLVSWLSGYRRKPSFHDEFAPLLKGLASETTSIGNLLAASGAPELAAPVLFHLCWTHELGIQTDRALTEDTLIWRVL